MTYGLLKGHVTDDVTWPQRCCEAVRSAILATAWLLVVHDIALIVVFILFCRLGGRIRSTAWVLGSTGSRDVTSRGVVTWPCRRYSVWLWFYRPWRCCVWPTLWYRRPMAGRRLTPSRRWTSLIRQRQQCRARRVTSHRSRPESATRTNITRRVIHDDDDDDEKWDTLIAQKYACLMAIDYTVSQKNMWLHFLQ